MNKVMLVGRVTRDLVLKYTKSGTAVTNFNIAVDKSMSKEDRQKAEAEGKPTADFVGCIAWGKLAENASNFMGKGSQCAVLGRVQTGSYQDKETGKLVYTTDIIAEKVEFLDSRNNAQNNAGATRGKNTSDFFEDDFQEIEDDGRIPF